MPICSLAIFTIYEPIPSSLPSSTSTASASVVITTDQAVRGGKTIPLKETVDEAVDGCDCVKKVFVSKRTGAQVPMHPRDIPMEEVRCMHTAAVAPR